MCAFRYDTLPNSEDHIRLLRFTSFSLSAPIKCTLTTSRLVPTLQYAAVSYTWGEIGAEREMIQLNRKPVAVQKNLYEFLRALQGWRESRALWIDAVCINQLLLQERNHQVRLMSTIYTNAAEVLVWLGPATDTSDEAMDFLQALSSLSSETIEQKPVAPKDKADGIVRKGLRRLGHFNVLGCADQDRSDLKATVAPLSTMGPTSRLWPEVAELCRCEYWKRVWILQEVALARKLTIYCGGKQMPEAAFRKAFSGRIHQQDDFPADPDTMMESAFWDGKAASPDTMIVMDLQFSYAAKVVSLRGEKRHNTLVDLLFQYESSKSHDVRDKVFALLGLASDCNSDSGIHADYGWDSARLFFEVMTFCHPRNTTQFGLLLQNLLEIETERPPWNLVRKVVSERQLSPGVQTPMIPIWASYTDLLGNHKLADEKGRPFPSEIKCFEYPSQRPKTYFVYRSGEQIAVEERHFVWFTKATAQPRDRVYSLAGCPLAFIFRKARARPNFMFRKYPERLNFVGLAVRKKYQHWEVAQELLRELYVPETLPALQIRNEEPMTTILVDYPTLVHSLILSYLPTEVVGET